MTTPRWNRQITIRRKATAADPEYIAPNANYGTATTVWLPLVAQAGSPLVAERFEAEVVDLLPSRSETVVQGLTIAKNQCRIRMRYRSDVDSSMRVTVHGDADLEYEIIGGPVEFKDRMSYIEMVCERYSS